MQRDLTIRWFLFSSTYYVKVKYRKNTSRLMYYVSDYYSVFASACLWGNRIHICMKKKIEKVGHATERERIFATMLSVGKYLNKKSNSLSLSFSRVCFVSRLTIEFFLNNGQVSACGVWCLIAISSAIKVFISVAIERMRWI